MENLNHSIKSVLSDAILNRDKSLIKRVIEAKADGNTEIMFVRCFEDALKIAQSQMDSKAVIFDNQFAETLATISAPKPIIQN